MFTKNSLLKEVWAEVKKVNPCDSSIEFFDKLLEKSPKITYGEAIKSFDSSSWSAWMLSEFINQSDEGVLKLFYEKITDPMMALKCCEKIQNRTLAISKTEMTILEAKFKGKLPVAEKEYQTKFTDVKTEVK